MHEQRIKQIYNKLLENFGLQHWWPVTKDNEIVPKYHKKLRLNEKQKLEICFGAILTQYTNWKNVEKAITNLNKNNLMDTKKINRINNKKLAKIIKSSGYHNQKAQKLKNFSYFLLKNYKGKINLLFNKNINELREELLSINGIGPETADSIILYAAKKPIFVIDAYTKRIYSRIFNIMKIKDFQDTRNFQFLRVKKELKYDELQNFFMNNLKKNEKLFNEYHALLVELGKNVCRAKPLCEKCPVSGYCSYYRILKQTHK